MKKLTDVSIRIISLLLLCTILLSACGKNGDNETVTDAQTDNIFEEKYNTEISDEVLNDKIKASWLAQMIGVSWAASTEFRYNGRIIPENEVPSWNRELFNHAFNQDDLYVEIPFMDAMKDNGSDCDVNKVAEYFRDSSFQLWHANYLARENLKNGLKAPESGSYEHNYHADDIDWQIECDFLGCMYPGMVNESAERAFELGHIMNAGDGCYGGVFITAMRSAAFTAKTLDEVIKAGMDSIPDGTTFKDCMNDVIRCYEEKKTFEECWQVIEDKWGKTDKCPEFPDDRNIDAKINSAYVLIGLLWGEGNFEDTLIISMRCGQDSDCNPSSAVGILATFTGMSGIDGKYLEKVDYNRRKFSYTEYTLNDALELNYDLTVDVLKKAGAVNENGVWKFNTEKTVKAVAFEQWPEDKIFIYLNLINEQNGKIRIDLNTVSPENINKITFDFGNGEIKEGKISKYQYDKAGKYTVKCTVETGKLTETVTREISVQISDNQ